MWNGVNVQVIIHYILIFSCFQQTSYIELTEYVHVEFIYFTKTLVLTDWFSPFILLFPTWNYHEIILIYTEI
jgi:hypothetical protein